MQASVNGNVVEFNKAITGASILRTMEIKAGDYL